jgi:hypothetical protein
MSDKTTIMRSFNNHFIDFISDIERLFPTNQDIKNGLKTFEMIKRVNPSIIIKIWHSNIYIPYNSVIQAGDITFFFDKNYADDLTYLSNAKEIMNIIDKIREPIKTMDSVSREHTTKYLQNLTSLSNLYFTM